MLSSECEELWAAYKEAERDRIRVLLLERLDVFLDRLLSESPDVWRPWALEIAEMVADGGSEIPIRLPLFRRVLLPALAEGVTRKEPGCARWLAHFASLFHLCDMSDLPDQMRTAVAFLQEAVRLDPDDSEARRRLVERHASYLNYTVHELPAGVLYGHNGATPEQCEELLELLAEFRTHVEIRGDQEKYTELINECGLHYRAYRDYLLTGRPGGSYERFVERDYSP